MFNKTILFALVLLLSSNLNGQNQTQVQKSASANDVGGYCKTNLAGSSFDVGSISITGTTFNFIGPGASSVTSDGSYYAEIAPTGTNTCILEPGRSYTLTINTTYSDIISLWIDFNQNGVFDTSEWTQVSTYASAGVNTSCNLNIPQLATIGQTAMRIRTRGYGNTNGAANACSSFGSGCTLDFTVSISNPTPAKPVAEFTSFSNIATPNSQIQFYDLTSGVPANWKWTFSGGNPATSTSQHPIVTYAANGTYNVKLVASNSIGADSIVKTGYINITNAITMPVSGNLSLTTCNAAIYDNGGTSSYANNSDGVLTVYPGTVGNAVKIDFNNFNVINYDYLYVYNGPTTAGTLLGQFTGSQIPPSITASNPAGALTLRFTSNSYDNSSGFQAQVSCANLVLQTVIGNSWTNSTDYNRNNYLQNKTLNFTVKNENTSSATVYTKIYKKLSSESSYTLLATTTSNTITAGSTYVYTTPINNFTTKASYDFKIELYNSANELLNTYDKTNYSTLGNQKFESSADDALPDYIISGIGGGSYDITAVSITGTTLNNTTTRSSVAQSDEMYYINWPASASNTCNLTSGMFYSLNVNSTNNYCNISAWIDYNQDKVFQPTEWINVASQSVSQNSVSFRVPITALSGQTRMRIRTNTYYSNNTASDAVSYFYNGCTEDYTITIVAQQPAIPKTDFSASETSIAFGTNVQFTDLSTGVPTAWAWSFQGGTPASSTSQSPSVMYNTPGKYPVKLVVTNALGKDSLIRLDYITVANSINVPATGSKTITACGITVYDHAATNNYSNSVNGTLTIYPSTANSAVCLRFSQFSTESYCDYLYVYNGTSTSAALIGSYSGNTIPADIIATNTTGALTLRFTADGSSVSTGFTAQATCVPLNSQYVSTVTWSSIIDNNYNNYAQSQQLNYTVKNDNSSAATLYAKIYCRRIGSTTDSLLTTTAQFTVAGNTLSSVQTYQVSGINQMDSYNFIIELYNSNNTLLNVFDYTNFPVLGQQKFESAANDGSPTFCTSNLGGGSFNISAVSIANTIFNNSAIRPAIRTLDGSYYTEFAANGNKTCTLVPGRSYTLSVTTNTYGYNISAWIDFNQDKNFQSGEYIAIATYANSGNAYSVDFTVPAGTAAGDVRMRIRTSSNSMSATNACSNFTSGCIEDYTLSIAGPATSTPKAEFSTSKTSVNAGEQIKFTDLSTNIPTSWKWTFTGGTPATSSIQNPTVSYSSAGTYDVKLVVTNAFGTDSIVKSSYISVSNSVLVPSSGTSSITSCGVTVYDNGGTGTYANSCNGTLTIYPSETGKMVRLQFSEFNTESSCDNLYIYNGATTTATLIGTYSGTTSPMQVTANNPTGALTLTFYTDGSVNQSGFVAQTSCVVPNQFDIKSVNWTNSIDNNYNGYTQSRTLNMIAQNNTGTKASTYAKIYYKLISASTFTLYGQSAAIAINANSASETFIYSISGLPTKGYYDFKIELYSSSNQLISTYDFNSNSSLKNQGFEPISTDGQGSYCISGLGGSGSDITAVSVTNTTLNNISTRAASSYNIFSGTGSNTGTLTWGGINTISVTTTNNDIISMWIDYDHNSTFDAGEWTLVSAASGAQAVSASFFIPTTALTGPARMRIRTRNAGTVNYSTDACTNFSSGCTEDYVITIDKFSGTQYANENVFKLYPNPAKDIINIEIPDLNTGVLTIFDSTGRKLITTNVSGSKFNQNISGLTAGIYFIHIKTNTGKTFNKQFIVLSN